MRFVLGDAHAAHCRYPVDKDLVVPL